MASTYYREYQPYSLDSSKLNDLHLSKETYQTNMNRQPLKTEYQTTNQNNLKCHPHYTVTQRFFPKDKIKDSPLYCLSSYQNEFPNWNGQQSPDQRFPERKQAIDQQFYPYTTTYKNFFDSNKHPNGITDLNPLPHKGPFTQHLPFLGTTETQQQYQPIQGNYTSFKGPMHGVKTFETSTYPGSFLTSSMLNSKLQNHCICPAKILAKTPFDKIKGKLLNSYNNYVKKRK